MSFLMNENLLEKYSETWTKVCNIIKKEFVIKPVYNEKYLRYLEIKIKVHNKKINTNFCDNAKEKFIMHLLINNFTRICHCIR